MWFQDKNKVLRIQEKDKKKGIQHLHHGELQAHGRGPLDNVQLALRRLAFAQVHHINTLDSIKQ